MLTSAGQAFDLLLMLGAGTGLIYILRWFWWRINAYTEIVAMVSSLFIAGYFNFINTGLESWQKITIGAILTTIVWIFATFITPPDDETTLRNFVKKVNPGGLGWNKFREPGTAEPWSVLNGIISMLLGCVAVYGFLLGTGQLIYGQTASGGMLLIMSGLAAFRLKKRFK
jgi:hypothetical protein